ncbi:hypothetical protein TNCT_553931 [Trichonephila clavata]|uniref:Uncharacterized protein n=1 Tax=Trichonephila clavata TaxID=2740835 RepID=A0A8X6GZG9_TRICU|nr:hypothetical protein TNCT_553931 [Trichonephila clavata]
MKLQNSLEHELTCYLLLRLVDYQLSLRLTEDFHNMRCHLLDRSPRLVFLILTTWRSPSPNRRPSLSERRVGDRFLVRLDEERKRKLGMQAPSTSNSSKLCRRFR